ncbi:MAG: hypothetical protein ABMB14_26615 [Myxococcota bacterium]
MADASEAMRRAGDDVEAGMFDGSRAKNLLHAGRLEEASQLLTHALERYGIPFGAQVGWLSAELAEIRQIEGRYAEAYALVVRALTHHRHGSGPAQLIQALVSAVRMAAKLGRTEDVVALVDECLAIPPSSRSSGSSTRCCGCTARWPSDRRGPRSTWPSGRGR